MSRTATCDRNTKETQIHIELNIDGTGQYNIDTGVGFFDHMLEGFARHGLFDLTVKVKGDTGIRPAWDTSLFQVFGSRYCIFQIQAYLR